MGMIVRRKIEKPSFALGNGTLASAQNRVVPAHSPRTLGRIHRARKLVSRKLRAAEHEVELVLQGMPGCQSLATQVGFR